MLTPTTPNDITYVAPPSGVGAADTAKITSAISRAGSNGVIQFRPGNYAVNARVTLSTAGQTLIIPRGTTLTLASGVNDHMLYITADHVTITGDGTIDGNRAGQSSGSVIYVASAEQTTISGITITGAEDNAIEVVGASGNTCDYTVVRGVRTLDCGEHHITFNTYASHSTIADCIMSAFVDTAQNGIWCGQTSSDLLIENNRIIDCARIGIEVWGGAAGGVGCDRSIIANNHISLSATNDGMGISVDNSQWTTVTANEITVNAAATGANCGIEIVGSDHCRVIGNAVKGPASTSLSVDSSVDTLLDGNTVDGSLLFGVQIVDGGSAFGVPSRTRITNNTFRNVVSRAVFINGSGVDYTVISKNTFEGNASNIYVFLGKYTTISGNLITAVSGNAITLQGTSRFTVTGNTINGDGTKIGVVLDNSSSGTVTGNDFFTLLRGVRLSGSSSYVFAAIAVSGNSFVTVTDPMSASLGTGATLGTGIVSSGNVGLSDYSNFASSVGQFTGTGTPEGVVTAGVGSTFRRTDGGANTTLYVKESGALTNTGWVAK